MTTNPNDEVREKMLQYFYDRNKNATSARGKRGSQMKISDIKSELKSTHGFTQQQVISNLTYLIDRGWVVHSEEQRSFMTRRGTAQPSTVDWYTISANGIDKLEGESSAFRRPDPFAGVNITAVGSTVQVGDGNYVNAQYSDLHGHLEELRQALLVSDDLDEATKFAAIADIETAKMQLAKPIPDRSTLRSVWPSIEKAAMAAGLLSNVTAISARISSLL